MKELDEMLTQLAGWCDPGKAQKLYELVTDNSIDSIIDVGVFEGKSTFALAFACRKRGRGKVYAVDSWSLDCCSEGLGESDLKFWTELDIAGFMLQFFRKALEFDLLRWIYPIRLNSRLASLALPEAGLIHLDANHSEYPSTSDVICWLPKLKSGGFLVMDDTHLASVGTSLKLAQEYCDVIDEISLPESHFTVLRKR